MDGRAGKVLSKDLWYQAEAGRSVNYKRYTNAWYDCWCPSWSTGMLETVRHPFRREFLIRMECDIKLTRKKGKLLWGT